MQYICLIFRFEKQTFLRELKESGLSLLLVVASLWWFLCGSSVFLPSQNQLSNFQFDLETGDEEPLRGICHCKFLFIYLFVYLFIYLFIYSIIHFIFYSCHLYKVRSAIVMWKRKRQRTSYVSGKETTQQKVSTSDNALPGYSVMWPWKVFDRKTVGKRS